MENKQNIEEVETKINFLRIDIRILEAQLEIGYKIVNVVKQVQNDPKNPSFIGYQAFATYVKMDEVDRIALEKHLENQKLELATIKAKQTVEFSFNTNQDEEKTN